MQGNYCGLLLAQVGLQCRYTRIPDFREISTSKRDQVATLLQDMLKSSVQASRDQLGYNIRHQNRFKLASEPF